MQAVHHPKLVAGRDQQAGLAGARADRPSSGRPRSRAPAPRSSRPPRRGRPARGPARPVAASRGGDLVALGMHRVLGRDRPTSTGLKVPGPDLEIESGDRPPLAPTAHRAASGVKCRPGRRRRARCPRPARRPSGSARSSSSVGVAGDVRRQRQPAEARDRLLGRGADEPDHAVAVGQHLDGLDRHVVAELDPLARAAARCPGFPSATQAPSAAGLDQQHLGRRAGGRVAEQPGVADPRGVEHQEVARGDQRAGAGRSSESTSTAPPTPVGRRAAWSVCRKTPVLASRRRVVADVRRRDGRRRRPTRRSARSTISRRLPPRSGSGSWAISSGGRS